MNPEIQAVRQQCPQHGGFVRLKFKNIRHRAFDRQFPRLRPAPMRDTEWNDLPLPPQA